MTPYIHVPTVFLMLLLGYGLLALLISLSQRPANDVAALRVWNTGSWALVWGFCAVAVRGLVPNWISVLGANWLLFMGATLYSQAVYHFLHGRSAPVALWLAWGLGCGGSLLLLESPRASRAIYASIVLILLLLPGLWQITRLRHQQARPLRLVGMTLTVTVVALCVRAVHAARVPQDYDDALQISLGQGMSFVLAFITMLGAGFGFVLAVLERNAEQMREMATHDGLTGCLNRITFDAMLLNALQRGLRTNEPVSLLMLDLDHFKAINDRYGHRAGDAVLRSFSEVVRTQLRASDTLARVGGEEFAVILPGTDAAGAAHVAESVREAVQCAAVDNQQGGVLRITISVGVACAHDGSCTSADLLYQWADTALYQAKAAGRNRVAPSSVAVLPPAIEPA